MDAMLSSTHTEQMHSVAHVKFNKHMRKPPSNNCLLLAIPIKCHQVQLSLCWSITLVFFMYWQMFEMSYVNHGSSLWCQSYLFEFLVFCSVSLPGFINKHINIIYDWK